MVLAAGFLTYLLRLSPSHFKKKQWHADGNPLKGKGLQQRVLSGIYARFPCLQNIAKEQKKIFRNNTQNIYLCILK